MVKCYNRFNYIIKDVYIHFLKHHTKLEVSNACGKASIAFGMVKPFCLDFLFQYGIFKG